jgi:alkylhydroperoxidase family enzyme
VTELAPLPRDQFDNESIAALRKAFPADVVDKFLEGSVPLPSAISTMLHHPKLAGSWLAYNNVLLWEPTLDARLRELMILRVAWRNHAPYEWVQHVKLGERFGVTRADVEAIANGTALDTWTSLERDAVAATDQLVDHTRVDDDTWSRLRDALDERQLVELVFVVGTYACLAMAFNTFGLSLAELDFDPTLPLPE